MRGLDKVFAQINKKNLSIFCGNIHRGIPNNLIKSFLSERTQRVKIDCSHSESLNITCGVSQGTELGPLLFIIFINNFLK